MPNFDTLMKQYDLLVEKEHGLRETLRKLEAERDRTKRALRALTTKESNGARHEADEDGGERDGGGSISNALLETARAVAARGKSASVAEIAEDLKITPGNAGVRLRRAMAANLIKKAGRGRFAIMPGALDERETSRKAEEPEGGTLL